MELIIPYISGNDRTLWYKIPVVFIVLCHSMGYSERTNGSPPVGEVSMSKLKGLIFQDNYLMSSFTIALM